MRDAKKNFVVIGNPIKHSLSPHIHAIFAKEAGLDMTYEPILSSLDQFKLTIHELIKKNISGANVTLPFKKEAYIIANTHSQEAVIAEACNTLEFKDNVIIGHNTDGIGLVRELEHNLQINLSHKKILLIGAGGAAEGVLYSLLEKTPSELTLTNRTIEKSNMMYKKMNTHANFFGVLLNVAEVKKLSPHYFDVIINATSASLNDTDLGMSDDVFHDKCLAYDMVYGKETPFIRQAKSQHAKTSDGLGMLVEQAAEAFFIWHQFKPQTQSVIQNLRIF